MRRRPKRKSVQIVVCPETGRRLCQDNRWREFANFGTYPECVKLFKYPQAALKAGERYRIKPAQPGDTINSIVYLYDGDSMDAAGRIYRESKEEPKTEKTEAKTSPYTIAYGKESAVC